MSTAPKPLFIFDNDCINYQNLPVLTHLNLSIYAGESVALLGKSGSGKSTLLKAMRAQFPNHTAWCPQESGLVEMLSVFHNIYMGSLERHHTLYNLANLIKPLKKEVDRIRQLLQKLQLEEKMMLPVGQLSGGQQQRVAIGRALFQQQDIFLGDEPVSALDEFQADTMLSLIRYHSETQVVALHDTAQALKTCDRVIGLRQGRIVLDSPSAELCVHDLAFLYD